MLREKVLELDKKMMELLSRRLEYAEKIGEVKRRACMPYQDPEYFNFSLKQKQEYGQKIGLDAAEIQVFFELLQDLSINRMKKNVPL